MAKRSKPKIVKPIMAWERPYDWHPKHECETCEGTGMGEKTMSARGELIDWDTCDVCDGTGEKPDEAK